MKTLINVYLINVHLHVEVHSAKSQLTAPVNVADVNRLLRLASASDLCCPD